MRARPGEPALRKQWRTRYGSDAPVSPGDKRKNNHRPGFPPGYASTIDSLLELEPDELLTRMSLRATLTRW